MQNRVVNIAKICLSILTFCIPTLPFFATNSILESSEITEAGTYEVEIWDETYTEKKTIRITVLYPRTTRSIEYNEAIDAYDIQIATGEFSTLSDEAIKKLANARAWNTLNNNPVDFIVAERIEKDTKNGWYQASFKTAYGTQTTINIIETNVLLSTETTTPFYLHLEEFFPFFDLAIVILLLLLVPLVLLFLLYLLFKKQRKKIQTLLDE